MLLQIILLHNGFLRTPTIEIQDAYARPTISAFSV